jgi:steroid Delta-isomerase
MELELQQLIRRYFEVVFEAPDVSTFTALFAPDGVLEDPVGTPPLHGRDAIGQFLAAGRTLIERIDFELHEIYPCGRECAVRWSAAITTKWGERVLTAGIGIFSFDDHHKLRHVREFYDVGVLQQLVSAGARSPSP